MATKKVKPEYFLILAKCSDGSVRRVSCTDEYYLCLADLFSKSIKEHDMMVEEPIDGIEIDLE